MNFTYQMPDNEAFMSTLRNYLIQTEQINLAQLLTHATCEMSSSGSFSGNRWDAYSATITFRVPLNIYDNFTEEVNNTLLKIVRHIFPKDAGYDFSVCEASPRIDITEQEHDLGLNNASLVSLGAIEHDGVRFRSKTETKIYDSLKKQNILFFPNPTAIVKSKKREPDFLICQNGKWGILEVMGDRFHNSNNAVSDHDRARIFKDFGVYCIEFFDAVRCYNQPDEVVEEFLRLLSKS